MYFAERSRTTSGSADRLCKDYTHRSGRTSSGSPSRATALIPHPLVRPRRRRRTDALRRLVRETELAAGDLIAPVFVVHGRGGRARGGLDAGRAPALGGRPPGPRDRSHRRPGHTRRDPVRPARGQGRGRDRGLRRRRHRAAGAPAAPGAPSRSCCSSPTSASASTPATATAAIVRRRRRWTTTRRSSVLGRVAVSHAEAGADVVAPSGMMDGMVGAIRRGARRRRLRRSRHPDLRGEVRQRVLRPVPRRGRVGAPASATARQYQMDPANVREALREVALDEAEGADMRDGQAGAAPTSTSSRAVRERFDAAAGGLQRERRVRHGQGGGAAAAGSTSGGWCWRR